MRIAALDIGGTAVKYCLYDSRCGFVKEDVRETPTNAELGGKAVLEQAMNLAAERKCFDAIAVSTAGQVNPETGAIIYATDNIPGYTGIQLKRELETRFRVPAFVENDVNAAALGEAAAGAGREYGSFLCLTYGTGIGGAIILNREVYRGSSFSAGEMGHMITHAGGLPCTCGNRGCYEQYASASALIRSVREQTGRNLNGREIFKLLKSDSRIERAVSVWIDEILYGLVSLIYIFNPPAVILGGGIMNEDLLCDSVRQRIGGLLMPSYRGVEILKASLGNTAGLQGAIWLAERSLKERGRVDHAV
ncbi:Beta-glucoside kinase [Caprobacter fermentans]|uniref:Beta-glucoside kinase n=1 Tax=Caproicibacter fermentans TaxID=2576756 RepID=A0A6N8HWD4_9FIRM|nr:ROK family protein [Caproicibacter fermentans]MVB10042.1 Beta-glucoside kinase [Caproicibacter fermentans]OCN02563.1 hypothetical protein A7X67_05415 [Clostridium sp. W14A]QNK42011.1 ROK family protein [Caproicibacter fermentans]